MDCFPSVQQIPGGKSYDAALVVGAALSKMIKDGFDVKEASLEFDFEGGISTRPWPPGQRLMDYIKNVSAIYPRIQLHLMLITECHFHCVTCLTFFIHADFH